MNSAFFIRVAPAIDAAIVLTSVATLIAYFRSPIHKAHFGMIFMLFATIMVYGILNLVCDVLYALPGNIVNHALWREDIRTFFLVAFTSLSTQLAVSFTSTVLAFDRVLMMTVPLKYNKYMIHRISTILTAVVTLAILVFFYVSPYAAGDTSARSLRFVFTTHDNMKNYILPASFTLETVFYIIFLFQLRRFAKNSRNGYSMKQAAQTNHVIIFQMIVTTVLCTIPNWIKTADSRYYNRQYAPFDQLVLDSFHLGVLLSISFALFKFRPKWRTVRIASNSTNLGRK